MHDQVSLCQKKQWKTCKTNTTYLVDGSVDAFCVALPMYHVISKWNAFLGFSPFI